VSDQEPFIGCTVKQLDPMDQFAAAVEATLINPANAPLFMPGADVPDDPLALVVLTNKYWGSGGVDLTFAFMDGADQATVKLFAEHANAWRTEGNANVNFRWTANVNDALVRISREATGYWSYLGTDIKQIARSRATMNLQDFTSRTPLSEWRRVVRHEVGHTLGFPHEHSRPDIVALLDPDKTIRYFRRTQGWSEKDVRAQILTSLNERSVMGSKPEVGSIMCYSFSGECTLNGKSIPGGADLTETDKVTAASLYPLAIKPPPVDPKPEAALVELFIGGNKVYSGKAA
jgi:hypothetical protein